MKLCDKLRKLLNPYTVEKIARATSINSQTIRKLRDNPGCDFKVATIRRIAEVLGVEPTWLLDDRQEWPPPHVSPNVEALAAA